TWPMSALAPDSTQGPDSTEEVADGWQPARQVNRPATETLRRSCSSCFLEARCIRDSSLVQCFRQGACRGRSSFGPSSYAVFGANRGGAEGAKGLLPEASAQLLSYSRIRRSSEESTPQGCRVGCGGRIGMRRAASASRRVVAGTLGALSAE